MIKGKRCPCGKSGSCPEHSEVKMVAYDTSDNRTVWYSFFKEERKYKRSEKLAENMGDRYAKIMGDTVRRILFYDNQIDALKPFKVI